MWPENVAPSVLTMLCDSVHFHNSSLCDRVSAGYWEGNTKGELTQTLGPFVLVPPVHALQIHLQFPTY